jgi:hypothetical protein
MESDCVLTNLQELATRRYPQLDEFRAHPHIKFLYDLFFRCFSRCSVSEEPLMDLFMSIYLSRFS